MSASLPGRISTLWVEPVRPARQQTKDSRYASRKTEADFCRAPRNGAGDRYRSAQGQISPLTNPAEECDQWTE